MRDSSTVTSALKPDNVPLHLCKKKKHRTTNAAAVSLRLCGTLSLFHVLTLPNAKRE